MIKILNKNLFSIVVLVFLILGFFKINAKHLENPCNQNEFITIAILAKNKEHCLPLYLECIQAQTWPKRKTLLYVRTNNNTDKTTEILKNWLNEVKSEYASVYFDDTDLQERVQDYTAHEWNPLRFSVLAKIRQDSIEWAKKQHSHYFVVDCDNFIYPHTLSALFEHRFQIVAPFLKLSDYRLYSNYHADICPDGYLKENNLYYDIFNQTTKGFIQVPVVHCSYFIRQDVLDDISYSDETKRHEYVIFSDNARKKNIPQYLDNREVYGRITFAENREELLEEHWLCDFAYTKAGNKLLTEKYQKHLDHIHNQFVPTDEQISVNDNPVQIPSND